jgi:hypothetical protein
MQTRLKSRHQVPLDGPFHLQLGVGLATVAGAEGEPRAVPEADRPLWWGSGCAARSGPRVVGGGVVQAGWNTGLVHEVSAPPEGFSLPPQVAVGRLPTGQPRLNSEEAGLRRAAAFFQSARRV